MGVENNECVVATTCDDKAMQKVKEWVGGLRDEERSLFAFVPALVNGKESVFLAPDGSKKGWDIAKHGEDLRNRLIKLLETFNYEDGSNPFD